MKLLKLAMTFGLALATPFISQAQSDSNNLVKDWERAKAYTQEYLEAMPADRFDFKATPETRSFAQQMLHLTEANYGFAAAATGTPSPFGQGEIESTADTSKEHVTQLVLGGYDFVIGQLKGLNEETLAKQVKLFDRFEMSADQAIQKAFEHQTHHRGQTTIYLRLAGVTPPQEKLF